MRRPKTHLAQNVRKTSFQPSTNAATTHFIAQVNTNESPNQKSACGIVATQRWALTLGGAMKTKKSNAGRQLQQGMD